MFTSSTGREAGVVGAGRGGGTGESSREMGAGPQLL